MCSPRRTIALPRAGVQVGLVNFAYVLLQLVVAAQTGSLAMLSDAFHNLSDVGAAWVAFKCERLARATPPPGFPFGMQRYQVGPGQ
jgi:Co/Zn/Cd efflux system component